MANINMQFGDDRLSSSVTAALGKEQGCDYDRMNGHGTEPSPVPLKDITNIPKTNGFHDDQDRSDKVDDSGDKADDEHDEASRDWDDADLAKAQKVLRQVEYYFGDENLARNNHLYGKMIKGSKNRPVPIEHVMTFPKMLEIGASRPFVVRALQESTELEVVTDNDKESILRRKQFRRSEYVPPGLPKSTKSSGTGTGFEEYFADAPITPNEAAEEADVYADDLPFAERIETAMQRFRARRTFQAKHNDVWTKFVKFGGVETGPKQFSGKLSKEEMEDMTFGDIARHNATEFVGMDKFETGPEAKWEVDFEGAAKAFLSIVVTDWCGSSSQDGVKRCTGVLRNFYNYIIHHNVCKEYNDDIYAARKICNIADEQLLGVSKIITEFPGDFNIACSSIFGGRWAESTAVTSWGDGSAADQLGKSAGEAKQIIALAAVANAPESWFNENGSRVKKELLEDQVLTDDEGEFDTGRNVGNGFEVVEIQRPDQEIRDLYKTSGGDFKVVGKLICKPWSAPDFDNFDLPRDFANPVRPERYEFWLEEELLDQCVVGTKFGAHVRKLSSGLYIIEGIAGAYPSFFMRILNELKYLPGHSKKWVEPREISREETLERQARQMGISQTAEAETTTQQGLQEGSEPAARTNGEDGTTASEADTLIGDVIANDAVITA